MKKLDIVTNPELSKKLKAAGVNMEPMLGFWFELHRVYKDHDHQRAAQQKDKTFRWEFNLPENKVPIYEQTTFSDEIGSYRLKLAARIPAYTMDELLSKLPVRLRYDDEYIRHIEVSGDKISICYRSKTSSFILGETIVDKSMVSAVGRMIITLAMQGCMN